MASAREFCEALLKKADVKIGGERPQDIAVHDERLYNRVIRYGTLGLGEAYMDGWWEANALDVFIHRVLAARLDKAIEINVASMLAIAKAFFFNLQSSKRAFTVGEAHYDLGNDLYAAMLDKRMVYTCGYWSSPSTGSTSSPQASSGHRVNTLDEAQDAKLDLVCRKIGLKKGDRVLDIGCGWGSWAKYAVEKYGASVVGITVSKEQAALARELCAGLPVEIRVQDYREVNPSTMLGAGEQFDHIVSLGMFEHVGVKNYRTYFDVANRCLKENGLFLLHTIGYKVSQLTSDPWIEKYIFPGGVLPSVAQIGKAIEGFFVMEDLHNFGADYDTTLMAWFANFDAAWPRLKKQYDERFYRMWKYYLLSCAGGFRARQMQLWQIVLSKNGVPGGYTSHR
ncbi:cyclopropane-fatty-acyl-phospholipid synthase [Candidatus Kaiserbacteria bacterium RIFCSPLOWO2_02_FULL_54_13]|uniref:Cyclopropane-fatty-acyl-phospholipid synthase n=1 Tax=Candidatus Kaiserbacteria bacterium RIFCSPHIGHO2_02_FULL_54_22 TaxID=1798495 RepID=A0A1F6DKL5_9BACT|nr:MAG: cyclopropane-fatty-acyl-phospholipid synthase [Candidatus Kaiserbacteria bacterium RIFCSPHIGHO2_02_FULL_54_22]OGG67951.1 MAG: cyclopropane-fatty-acyl-phospholipid synthase [Candidatus Kaiserbacteria bacterium RIFCSPHIGHO2_12_FULL_54_16]OGG84098.1 MAG: cyclopropane-fatty-acyl-phospholipid synthase [Candidatus Kaiserbacteria bacterium RIFCSPLOWO2_02_FULL_54_13]OGG90006.1 MAG: cyclopropane-fatty-acyl-phospholipid synthase [Candidatus Kaiserbacteria bacterium RIFCSPLOWO2_12_FULL_54_10]